MTFVCVCVLFFFCFAPFLSYHLVASIRQFQHEDRRQNYSQTLSNMFSNDVCRYFVFYSRVCRILYALQFTTFLECWMPTLAHLIKKIVSFFIECGEHFSLYLLHIIIFIVTDVRLLRTLILVKEIANEKAKKIKQSQRRQNQNNKSTNHRFCKFFLFNLKRSQKSEKCMK